LFALFFVNLFSLYSSVQKPGHMSTFQHVSATTAKEAAAAAAAAFGSVTNACQITTAFCVKSGRLSCLGVF
jgi:hypothetical protein